MKPCAGGLHTYPLASICLGAVNKGAWERDLGRTPYQPKLMNGLGTGTGSPSTFTYLKRERREKTAKRNLRNMALSLGGCDTLSRIASIK